MRLTVLSVSYSLGVVSPRTAGGAEQILATLDRHLSHSGHQSIVIASKGSRTAGLLLATPPPAECLDQEAKRRGRETHRRAIEGALKRFPIDIIHFHGIDFLEYVPFVKIPAVVTLHLPLAWYPPEALCLQPPHSQLVCVSESQRRSARREITAKLILNGVPINVPDSVRHRSTYALILGRICPEKGIHLAIDATLRSGIPLVIAGEVAGYPEHRTYFDRKIRPRLGRNVRFLGHVGGRGKHALLAGARVLLIPSLVPETSSISAMEAMACGTPVIAYPQGALPEIVEHGKTGFIVETVGQITDALAAIDRIDRRKCRQAAEDRFSDSRMYKEYLDLYLNMVKQEARPVRNFPFRLPFPDPGTLLRKTG